MRSFKGLRLVTSAKIRPLGGRRRNPARMHDPRGRDLDDACTDWLFGDLLIPDRGPIPKSEGCGGNESSAEVQRPARAPTALRLSAVPREDEEDEPKDL